MSFRSLLRHRCTIKRNTKTLVDGEVTNTWADLATDVPCLVQEGQGSIGLAIDGQALMYDATCFLLAGQDVRPRGRDDQSDRLIVTRPTTGASFVVLHVADTAGIAHHLTAYLRRLPAP